MSDRPTVLYACIHNSGRSVAAKVLTEHYADGAVGVGSAGPEPGAGVNPAGHDLEAVRRIVDDVDARVRLLAELGVSDVTGR